MAVPYRDDESIGNREDTGGIIGDPQREDYVSQVIIFTAGCQSVKKRSVTEQDKAAFRTGVFKLLHQCKGDIQFFCRFQ